MYTYKNMESNHFFTVSVQNIPTKVFNKNIIKNWLSTVIIIKTL